MTYKDALEILRDTAIDIRSTREDDIHTLYATAQLIAMDCIEKQIPQQPSVTDVYPHRVYCECGFNFAYNKDTAKAMGVLMMYPYCPSCGQAIDWSEEEEEE